MAVRDGRVFVGNPHNKNEVVELEPVAGGVFMAGTGVSVNITGQSTAIEVTPETVRSFGDFTYDSTNKRILSPAVDGVYLVGSCTVTATGATDSKSIRYQVVGFDDTYTTAALAQTSTNRSVTFGWGGYAQGGVSYLALEMLNDTDTTNANVSFTLQGLAFRAPWTTHISE